MTPDLWDIAQYFVAPAVAAMLLTAVVIAVVSR
jgi:hypothetical protein